MKNVLIGVLFAAAGGALSISCGSSSGPGDSSGVPRTLTVGSLSPTQAVMMCDWSNVKQGGYGQTATCSDGRMVTTDTNQAECVAGASYTQTVCPTLTVADVEDCVNAIGANLCEILTASACANLAACLGY